MSWKRVDSAVSLSLFAYATGTVTLPICLITITNELDVSLFNISALNLPRGLLEITLILISGFLASRWTQVRLLKISTLVSAAGFLLFYFVDNLVIMLVFIMIISIGNSLLEALANPLVQESHPPEEAARFLNITNAFWSIGILFSSLIIGRLLMLGVNWRYLFMMVGLLYITAFFIFPRSIKVPVPKPRVDFTHLKEIFGIRSFWIIMGMMVAAGGVEGAFTFWSASYIQLNYGGSAWMGAVGTAVFAASMVVGRLLSARLVNTFGIVSLILMSGVIGFLTSLIPPIMGNLSLEFFFVVLIMAGLSVACLWPTIQSYGAGKIDMDTTLLMVLFSCAGIPGFGLTVLSIGFLADRFSMREGFVLIPILFAMLILLTFTIKNRDNDSGTGSHRI